jgi:hypothetical protein
VNAAVEAELGAERAYRKIFERELRAKWRKHAALAVLVIRDPEIKIGSHRSRARTPIAIERQDLPHSRPLPTARAFKSHHQVGQSREWHGPTPTLGFVRRH